MAAIPNRAVFRSQEVCEIAEVQPYVLRSWEAEFPDLGLSKGSGAPRVYRRGDIERVLRIKHLLLVEGLTLAGARRQLSEEDPALASSGAVVDETALPDAEVAKLLDREVRKTLGDVRSGLHGILGVLSGNGNITLHRASSRDSRRAVKKAGKSAKSGKQVRSSRPSRSARPSRAAKRAGKKKR